MKSGHEVKIRLRLALVVAGGLALITLPTCKQNPSSAGGIDGGASADVTPREDERADEPPMPDAGKISKVCPSGAINRSKGKSEDCTCDDECQTGFCVDGVCCASACDSTCKACNLPSSLGECAFVPAGTRPRDPAVCPASTPATCGADGTCDGKGACRKYVQGTECRVGTCAGDGISGVMTCDGQGQCAQTTEILCPPYTCDSSTNRCMFRCATNGECAAGQQCVNRSCGQKFNGSVCSSSDECTSGFCADGVCCNVACDGACLACNQTGSLGRCKFVGAGQPHRACPAQNRGTCGTTGLCDGFGSCAVFPENTVCKPAVCSGDALLSTASTCDGKGTCREPQLVDCQPYNCRNAACTPRCSTDQDCAQGIACTQNVGGRLSCGKKQNGQSCQAADECSSGQCVDGVCCESRCEGPCRSCDLPGSPGRCLNAANGAEDPRAICQNEGAGSCGRNGLCDGSGACQTYAVGEVCAPESCVAGTYTPSSTCNAAGQCVSPRSIPCSPFLCNGTRCFATCTNDQQCIPGQVCSNSSCGPKPNGATCSSGGECQSGACAQGVCCNQACSDSCMDCDMAATLGLCTKVEDGSPDPQGKCKATASSTCGTTGLCKGGECALFDKGKNCKPAMCVSSSSQEPASTCDGAGACITPAPLSCGAFTCSGDACKASCTSDADCVPPSTCVGNSCGLKSLGTACTTNGQCLSGHCSEGVCCDSACSDDSASGLCRSCRVAGKVGTCLSVPAGNVDPKGRCVATNPSTGSCGRDGTCDGAGACRAWSASTGCRAASCSGGRLTLSVNCDGRGNCPDALSVSCAPYLCSTSSPSCLNTCRSNGDCAAGIVCNLETKRCGDKLQNGEQCKIGTDCTSGNCVDGTCCNSPCSGACESCSLSGTVGLCSPIATGKDPRLGTTTCVKSTESCGNTGKCDGARGCEQQKTCDDRNACTQTDTCDGTGHCVGRDPVICSALDACHDPGTCDSATGTCSNPAKIDGANCSDGDLCTRTDTCQKGICVGGDPVVCIASDQCHSEGICSSTTGLCSDPRKPDTSPCNDGDACTSDDKCQAGVCGGTKYTCGVPGQCQQAGVCKGDGTCSFADKTNGTVCDDGVACTSSDKCSGGVCAGTSYTCGAPGPCQLAGVCKGDGTCSYENQPDGTKCDDGIACTSLDKCTGGVCAGTSYTCAAPGQCQQTGVCKGDGTCSFAEKPTGSDCDDNDKCTQKDTCQAGQCVGADPKTCPAPDLCHEDAVCDPQSGLCGSNPTKGDGTPCSQGKECRNPDSCKAGVCVGGDPVTDGTACGLLGSSNTCQGGDCVPPSIPDAGG